MITKIHFKFALLALLLALVTKAIAAPPDLTNSGVPSDTISFNMGTTGARGWVYHIRENSSESRQIQIKSVSTGSPAVGVLAANDVILGADGSGAAPINFTYDARRALADAINAAEARDPATLQLIRWRAGMTNTVTLTLRTMGAYSSTAPYNCPKSTKILEDGLQYIQNNGETAGAYSFGTLALIAGNNPSNTANAARLTRAQTEARAKVPSASVRAQMMADTRDTNGLITWERGHTLIMLAEYFLLTGDAQVLPGIEAYAVNIAKNTSMFGTTGHMYAHKNPDGSPNGALGNGYGAVNSAAMPCHLGLLLAKKCGLTRPEIDPAIQRASRFFAYYTGKGAIPYGEHEAYWEGHDNNGKSGLAALCFKLETHRAQETRFFTRMAIAAASERGEGHTGAFFNYLWSPLGAAVGGEEAAASHFSRVRWMLDLNRKWNGSFDYDCLSGEGSNSGSQYNGFRMSTAALLTYALPLRQLHLTGKSPNSIHILNSTTVVESAAVDAYNSDPLTNAQLLTDLGNWSPKVHRSAAIELATRSITTSTLAQITALANDTNGSSRFGACITLGRISNSSTAAARANTLVALLSDSNNHVRFMAADAMRNLPQANKSAHLNTIMSLCASQVLPLVPFVEGDPMQLAHGRLCYLFTNTINSSITGVNRALLLPAIRAVTYHPTGFVRSALPGIYNKLTQQEIFEIADAIVDSIHKPIPADRMFGRDTQAPILAKLAQYRIAEAVPISKIIINREDTTTIKTAVLSSLQSYGRASVSVRPDPEIIPFLEILKTNSATATAAQAVLDAIAADSNPVAATPLKSLATSSADAATLTLPTSQTTLRATGFDYAKGDSVFTWRKIHGKGTATFSPNGNTSAKDSTLTFDAQPGKYLFEVTLSDSRGLTEVTRTVPVTLFDSSGTLPPNSPPLANSLTISAPRNLPIPINLSGSDPELFPLVYRLVSQPTQGTLSGIPPDLTYTANSNGVLTADGFAFEVIDSEGQVDGALIDININNAINVGAIQWEPATNTTIPTNIVTTGTLVGSRTGDDTSGTITVNNVAFAPGKILGTGGTSQTVCPDTGSGVANTALESLLDTISWNGSSFQLTGLTAGSNYLVQIFLCDYRLTNRQMILGDTKSPPNTVTLVADPANAFGQFVTGSFTAASNIQTITVAGVGDDVSHINAWQLRLLSDSTPPSPDPAAWATLPNASSPFAINMSAVIAYDSTGVEYFFDETSGNPGATDSGWQDSSAYHDNGLTPGMTYIYTVSSRDKSPARNLASGSAPITVTTPVLPSIVWNVNFHDLITPSDNFVGAAAENTQASIWNRIGGATDSLPATARLLADSEGSTSAGVNIDLSASTLGGNARTNTGNRTFAGAPKLFGGYLGGDLTTSTLQINGLNPARNYSIIIYSDWFFRNGGDSGLPVAQTIGSGLATRVFVNRQNVGTNGSVVPLGQDTNPANVVGNTNWYQISGLSPNASGQLGFSIGAFGQAAGERSNTAFNGFQLIAVGSAATNDYMVWSSNYAPADLTNPASDSDGDGMSNYAERAFGLNPTSAASSNPISVSLNPTAGTFSYARRNPVLTNMTYTVWTSTRLGEWTMDDTAIQTPSSPDAYGIQAVAVSLSPGLLTNPSLFVRIRATGPLSSPNP